MGNYFSRYIGILTGKMLIFTPYCWFKNEIINVTFHKRKSLLQCNGTNENNVICSTHFFSYLIEQHYRVKHEFKGKPY